MKKSFLLPITFSCLSFSTYAAGLSNLDAYNPAELKRINQNLTVLPPAINMTAADVNHNGAVTIDDALNIAKHSIGLVIIGTCF